MNNMFLLLLTFFCGSAYECGCVFWVHYSEKGRTVPAIAWSCFNALVTMIGLGEALNRPLFILVYMVGFGTGTGLAIEMKRKWLKA